MIEIENRPAAPAAAAPDHEVVLHDAARHLLTMRRVMRLVVQQAKAQSLLPEGLRMGEAQLHVLYILSEEGQLTAGELAERCHVADPTMSKTLNHLEAQGLVLRRIDPSNRRVVQVTATEEGRAVLDHVGAEFIESLARVLRPLATNQLHDLILAMGHLESLVGPEDRAHDAPHETQGVK